MIRSSHWSLIKSPMSACSHCVQCSSLNPCSKGLLKHDIQSFSYSANVFLGGNFGKEQLSESWLVFHYSKDKNSMKYELYRTVALLFHAPHNSEHPVIDHKHRSTSQQCEQNSCLSASTIYVTEAQVLGIKNRLRS